ncbi:hypothetical protein OF83DRAFT_868449 [Amylostereum chailletii]|nr:hypothetical protein OF83DRAFT_868449 [Amylostereum chailletii]
MLLRDVMRLSSAINAIILIARRLEAEGGKVTITPHARRHPGPGLTTCSMRPARRLRCARPDSSFSFASTVSLSTPHRAPLSGSRMGRPSVLPSANVHELSPFDTMECYHVLIFQVACVAGPDNALSPEQRHQSTKRYPLNARTKTCFELETLNVLNNADENIQFPQRIVLKSWGPPGSRTNKIGAYLDELGRTLGSVQMNSRRFWPSWPDCRQ